MTNETALREALAGSFCVAESKGHPEPGHGSYRLIFSFSNLDALHKAHAAYIALQSPSQAVVAEAVDKPNPFGNGNLNAALAWARNWMATASEDEKQAMWKAQRESWSKGPHGPTDGMGTVYIPAAHPQASPPPVQSVVDRELNTKPVVDHESGFGVTQTVQSEVTQADREAAASFYQEHLARPGEVPVAAAMRMRHIDDSPLIQAFRAHRLAHSQPDTQEGEA